MTTKRFRTVGSTTKIDNNPPAIKAGRTFATVSGTAVPKKAANSVTVLAKNDSSVVIVTADRKPYSNSTRADIKPPFDLDGTETHIQSVEVSVPTLRRPAKVAPVAEKPKAKPTKSKAPVPAKKAGEKPALAKRDPKAKVEVTAPIKATKKSEAAVPAIVKAAKAKADVAAKAVFAEATKTVAKPGKVADKKANDKALKAGTLVKAEPKAKVAKKSTASKVKPIKPAKTVKAPVAKAAKPKAAKPAKK